MYIQHKDNPVFQDLITHFGENIDRNPVLGLTTLGDLQAAARLPSVLTAYQGTDKPEIIQHTVLRKALGLHMPRTAPVDAPAEASHNQSVPAFPSTTTAVITAGLSARKVEEPTMTATSTQLSSPQPSIPQAKAVEVKVAPASNVKEEKVNLPQKNKAEKPSGLARYSAINVQKFATPDFDQNKQELNKAKGDVVLRHNNVRMTPTVSPSRSNKR
jgi:hypothetical protein